MIPCAEQIGAESVNLVAGDKPADVYSGIAARYFGVNVLHFSVFLVLSSFSNRHNSFKFQLKFSAHG